MSRACEKAGGRLLRASTFVTKLSPTCPCGEPVKKTLGERVHRCGVCGLVADRDMVSATLAAHVRLTDLEDPSTAAAHRPKAPAQRAPARQSTATRYRPTPNEAPPARMRHKAHVGTATPARNTPPTGGTPEQELDGGHPITG
ncbi:hypothetical protein ACFV0T_29580 [Streptomyces sp. NPDC059582]|uniref:zinc ribbon domain-containing protein n=1 Tax=Streptomyces sp. NPDC059582 TaxID=3346875 RepID=UPI0036853C45